MMHDANLNCQFECFPGKQYVLNRHYILGNNYVCVPVPCV